MSTVCATVPSAPSHGPLDAAKAEAPGFALLFGALDEAMPDAARLDAARLDAARLDVAMREDKARSHGPADEAKRETMCLPPDPAQALVLPLPGMAAAAPSLFAAPAAALVADPDAQTATRLIAPSPSFSSRASVNGDLPSLSDTRAAGLAAGLLCDAEAALWQHAASALTEGPHLAAAPASDSAARQDAASPTRSTSGLAGEAVRLPALSAVSLAIEVEGSPDAFAHPAAGAPRPARGSLAQAPGALAGESAGALQPLDASAAMPGLVAVADSSSELPKSGPEWTEPGKGDAREVSLPETVADALDASEPEVGGHVQTARLTVGYDERLRITLGAVTEASRALLERETPGLASDLAAAGAKVEAIRVDLVARLHPDGRADAAGGPHPGPGQGGGAPFEQGAPRERANAPLPDAPAGLGMPGPERPVASDGGKIDRYA
ncbi:hypothetical protein [Thermaurantiacus sp.]